MSNPYQILGYGGFGAVVGPALPNVDATGQVINFGPDMVTKVMFHKKNYKKALQDAADLENKVPLLAIPITPYRHQYSIRDVADGIPGMRKYITKHQSSYSGAYLVRMPNLGYSFADIEKRISLQYGVGMLSPETIATQILKLMRIVKYIGKADYIHGDIRETNVLCNTTTGDMTIIDFDWLLKKSVYNTTYPVYFYSHPPEELYFLNGGAHLKYLISKYNRSTFMTTVINEIENHLASNSAYNKFWQQNYWIRTLPQQPHAVNELFIYELMRTLTTVYDYTHGLPSANIKARPIADAFKLWNEKSMGTVDSFGLAVALEAPLRAALAGSKAHKPLMDFLLNDLFFGMKNVFLLNRITIDEAIEKFEKFLRVAYPAIGLGDQPDFDDELARLAGIDPSIAEKNTPKPQPKHRTVAKELEAYAALVRAQVGMSPEKSPLPSLPPSRGSTQSRSTRSHSSPHVVGGRRSRQTRKRTSGK